MPVTVGEQVHGSQGVHFIQADECSLADLQADGEEARRTSRLHSLGTFSLGVHSVNACGLAIELIEFIQGEQMNSQVKYTACVKVNHLQVPF